MSRRRKNQIIVLFLALFLSILNIDIAFCAEGVRGSESGGTGCGYDSLFGARTNSAWVLQSTNILSHCEVPGYAYAYFEYVGEWPADSVTVLFPYSQSVGGLEGDMSLKDCYGKGANGFYLGGSLKYASVSKSTSDFTFHTTIRTNKDGVSTAPGYSIYVTDAGDINETIKDDKDGKFNYATQLRGLYIAGASRGDSGSIQYGSPSSNYLMGGDGFDEENLFSLGNTISNWSINYAAYYQRYDSNIDTDSNMWNTFLGGKDEKGITRNATDKDSKYHEKTVGDLYGEAHQWSRDHGVWEGGTFNINTSPQIIYKKTENGYMPFAYLKYFIKPSGEHLGDSEQQGSYYSYLAYDFGQNEVTFSDINGDNEEKMNEAARNMLKYYRQNGKDSGPMLAAVCDWESTDASKPNVEIRYNNEAKVGDGEHVGTDKKEDTVTLGVAEQKPSLEVYHYITAKAGYKGNNEKLEIYDSISKESSQWKGGNGSGIGSRNVDGFEDVSPNGTFSIATYNVSDGETSAWGKLFGGNGYNAKRGYRFYDFTATDESKKGDSPLALAPGTYKTVEAYTKAKTGSTEKSTETVKLTLQRPVGYIPLKASVSIAISNKNHVVDSNEKRILIKSSSTGFRVNSSLGIDRDSEAADNLDKYSYGELTKTNSAPKKGGSIEPTLYKDGQKESTQLSELSKLGFPVSSEYFKGTDNSKSAKIEAKRGRVSFSGNSIAFIPYQGAVTATIEGEFPKYMYNASISTGSSNSEEPKFSNAKMKSTGSQDIERTSGDCTKYNKVSGQNRTYGVYGETRNYVQFSVGKGENSSTAIGGSKGANAQAIVSTDGLSSADIWAKPGDIVSSSIYFCLGSAYASDYTTDNVIKLSDPVIKMSSSHTGTTSSSSAGIINRSSSVLDSRNNIIVKAKNDLQSDNDGRYDFSYEASSGNSNTYKSIDRTDLGRTLTNTLTMTDAIIREGKASETDTQTKSINVKVPYNYYLSTSVKITGTSDVITSRSSENIRYDISVNVNPRKNEKVGGASYGTSTKETATKVYVYTISKEVSAENIKEAYKSYKDNVVFYDNVAESDLNSWIKNKYDISTDDSSSNIKMVASYLANEKKEYNTDNKNNIVSFVFDLSDGSSDNFTREYYESDDIHVGDKVCIVSAAYPADSHNYMSADKYAIPDTIDQSAALQNGIGKNGVIEGESYWAISTPSCATIGKYPMMSVESGDMYSRGKVKSGYTYSKKTGRTYGSWTEYGLYALMIKESVYPSGFASSAAMGYNHIDLSSGDRNSTNRSYSPNSVIGSQYGGGNETNNPNGCTNFTINTINADLNCNNIMNATSGRSDYYSTISNGDTRGMELKDSLRNSILHYFYDGNAIAENTPTLTANISSDNFTSTIMSGMSNCNNPDMNCIDGRAMLYANGGILGIGTSSIQRTYYDLEYNEPEEVAPINSWTCPDGAISSYEGSTMKCLKYKDTTGYTMEYDNSKGRNVYFKCPDGTIMGGDYGNHNCYIENDVSGSDIVFRRSQNNGTTVTDYLIYSGSEITIDSNIIIDDAGTTSPDEIVNVMIVSEGNIKIGAGVTRIDAWLITGGKLFTCYKDGGYIFDDTDEKRKDLNSSRCTQSLFINAPVSTNEAYFYRTAGGETKDLMLRSEILNYNPMNILWGSAKGETSEPVGEPGVPTIELKSISEKELPTRY